VLLIWVSPGVVYRRVVLVVVVVVAVVLTAWVVIVVVVLSASQARSNARMERKASLDIADRSKFMSPGNEEA